MTERVAVPNFTVVQTCWVVADIEASMAQLSADLGYGPWLVLRHIKVPLVTHYGRPTTFKHTAALTQAGGVQIELAQSHDDEPSVYNDVYPRGQAGFHHTALFVDDFAGTVAAYEAAGYPLVQHYDLPGGTESGFVDTRAVNGHMIEVLEESAGLRRLYALVADLGREHARDEIVEAASVMELLA